MRLIVIDVAFSAEVPASEALIAAIASAMPPVMELEHMFALDSGPRVLSCCFYLNSDGAAGDLVRLVDSALVALVGAARWRILRVRESI